MIRTMLKSKIHRVKVTEACLDYEGSITVDASLLEAANLIEYEQVDVYNINNGARFTTYVIKGEPGSGVVCLNGAAARMVAVKDLVIICSYVGVDDADCGIHMAINVFVDDANQINRIA
ncbi:MAG: aspartate 1-decarboxylase [Desulfomonilaceae bacterium]|nr:aspartate 1-decarboxylase [Desulfomonilaceae bacterium]